MREIKDLFISYTSDKIKIKAIELEIRKIEYEEVGINGSNFEINGDIRPQGYMSSGLENKSIKRIDDIQLLKSRKALLESKIELTDNIIKALREDDREYIEDYYIKRMNSIDLMKKYRFAEDSYIYKKLKRLIKKINNEYSEVLKNILKR